MSSPDNTTTMEDLSSLPPTPATETETADPVDETNIVAATAAADDEDGDEEPVLSDEEAARLEREKQELADQVVILQQRLQLMNSTKSFAVGGELSSVPEDIPAKMGHVIEFQASADGHDDVESLITFDQSANSGWTSKQSSTVATKSYKPKTPQFQHPISEEDEVSLSNRTDSKAWRLLTSLCTCWIPDSCIRRDGVQGKQTWRYVLFVFLERWKVRSQLCIFFHSIIENTEKRSRYVWLRQW